MNEAIKHSTERKYSNGKSLSEIESELLRIGMRIGGGRAYNKIGNMERLLRDAYASQIMALSLDVLNIWLGKLITGQEL